MKRRVILSSIAMVIVFVAVTLDIISYSSKESCQFCSSFRDVKVTSITVCLLTWRNEELSELQPGLFVRDFPDFECSHNFQHSEDKLSNIWNSPVIIQSPINYINSESSQSLITELYIDEMFRDSLNKLIADGIITRQRVLEIAKSNCIDGGRCRLSSENSGDMALLNLIDSVEIN
ncbi:hypothetical protein ACFSW8_03810 [Rubritalea tangerina]|uniref:Uncharacterized protein n=2 Tax=Rubritalea tangerina TaxID=430798 RepID=A0ABW4Z8D8_9BACT